VIDLIYRVNGQWKLIDFKADELRNEEVLEAAINRYRPQIRRYITASSQLMGVNVEGALCFLDFMGEIKTVRFS
jgi:ATP-dependent exoDNAse (exonuclease V) beta subunit